MKRKLAYLLYLALATGCVLLAVEVCLRLFLGLPRGLFHFTPLGNTSLYCPNSAMNVLIMPIPYTIKTNSLGFRGREIALEKSPGTTRIIALGDSVTDGYMVDNEDTYPQLLEDFLRAKGHEVEAVNAARGGGTIDLEYEILRKFCMQLDPDYVLLTFCCNDIYEMGYRTREELINRNTLEFEPDSASEWLLFGRTAIGEVVLDTMLRLTREQYRAHERHLAAKEKRDRYVIPGGTDYAANLERFEQAFKFSGLLEPRLPEAVRARIDDYLYVLDHMNQYCKDKGARLVFVYYPHYRQIYAPDSPTHIRDVLRDGANGLGIPFIDATPHFRAQDRNIPLFMAPLDYHANPAGNRVLAEAIGQGLTKLGLPARPQAIKTAPERIRTAAREKGPIQADESEGWR